MVGLVSTTGNMLLEVFSNNCPRIERFKQATWNWLAISMDGTGTHIILKSSMTEPQWNFDFFLEKTSVVGTFSFLIILMVLQDYNMVADWKYSSYFLNLTSSGFCWNGIWKMGRPHSSMDNQSVAKREMAIRWRLLGTFSSISMALSNPYTRLLSRSPYIRSPQWVFRR